MKAVEAAIQSRQWNKAVQILQVVGEGPKVQKYYKKIADHYSNIGEYTKAEKYYIQADATKSAIDMYNGVGKWEEAHRLAGTCMKQEEVASLYIKQAEELETKGRYKESERLVDG